MQRQGQKLKQNDNNSNQTENLPDQNSKSADDTRTLKVGWVVHEEVGYYETSSTVIDLRTNKKYTKLAPHWVIKNGFREDLVEEWHPFCLCYECAYKLGWNGMSYCVGQPKFRKEYKCDCCDKKLFHESGRFSWNQSYALGLDNITYADILNVQKINYEQCF
jgi:hypothetical protein